MIEYFAEVTVADGAHKLGLERWRTAILGQVEDALFSAEDINLDTGDPYDSDDTKDAENNAIHSVYDDLERYERSEVLNLLELGGWQWKLTCGQAAPARVCGEKKRLKLDDCQAARVNCGADLIITNVVPFM